mmetsp:Transcript_10006/g.22420  ORF Transcript_10006/g.22420 Transcript_10006/m.22420 type:complete len:218 (-) Transcript_10006:22-675(-)
MPSGPTLATISTSGTATPYAVPLMMLLLAKTAMLTSGKISARADLTCDLNFCRIASDSADTATFWRNSSTCPQNVSASKVGATNGATVALETFADEPCFSNLALFCDLLGEELLRAVCFSHTAILCREERRYGRPFTGLKYGSFIAVMTRTAIIARTSKMMSITVRDAGTAFSKADEDDRASTIESAMEVNIQTAHFGCKSARPQVVGCPIWRPQGN